MSERPTAPDRAREVDPDQPLPGRAELGGPGVFGVLSIVFGSLMVLLDLSGGCAVGCTRDLTQLDIHTTAVDAGQREQLSQAYERYERATVLPMLISTGLHLVLSALLIAVGVGQLRRRGWAPRASLWWAVAAMVSLGISLASHLVVIRPAMARYTAAQVRLLPPAAAEAARLSSQLGNVVAWGMTALAVPYPLLLAIYFSRPRVRAAMDR